MNNLLYFSWSILRHLIITTLTSSKTLFWIWIWSGFNHNKRTLAAIIDKNNTKTSMLLPTCHKSRLLLLTTVLYGNVTEDYSLCNVHFLRNWGKNDTISPSYTGTTGLFCAWPWILYNKVSRKALFTHSMLTVLTMVKHKMVRWGNICT